MKDLIKADRRRSRSLIVSIESVSYLLVSVILFLTFSRCLRGWRQSHLVYTEVTVAPCARDSAEK